MGRKHSLHTFVHRTLIYRLIAVGGALSLLIGLGVLLMERDRVSREAIAVAVDRLALFSGLNEALLADPDQLDADALHQAALDFRATRSPIHSGAFAFIGIYNLKGAKVIDFYDDTHDRLNAVKAVQQSSPLLIPHRGAPRYEIVRIAGRPYLRSALPLSTSNGQTVGIINGFFAFSPKTIHAFRMRGLRAMVGAMLIVLLTTAMVYPVILKLTKRITQFSVRLLEANLDTLETLGSAIAQRDSDTNAHNYRVTLYAARLGEEQGLPARTMRTLIKGAFLHDVGKIGIPDEVLLKPGRLDDTEYAIMKTHVDHGCDIIERSTWLSDALEVIRSHHEKMTGKGYPMGLAGEGIPITARIFAIADVFDALTSKRPYKAAWSFDEAMEILEEGRGTHFDPQLLDTFGRIARPLYDHYGGKEKIFRDELDEILTTYFHEGMDNLDY